MKMLLTLAVAAVAWLIPGSASACPCCNHDTGHHAHAAAQPSAAPAAQLGPGEVRAKIPVAGMHCGGCVSRVQSALSKLEGVKRANASLDPGEVTVVYEKATITPPKLVEVIDALGFKAGTPAAN